MNWFIVGLDLGKAQDYTALALVERIWEPGDAPWWEWPDPDYHLRNLERFPIGTSYQAVTDTLVELWKNEKMVDQQKTLVVDATGVGNAVVEMLRAAGLAPLAVTITGGNAARWDQASRSCCVPKRDLVGRLQVLLQNSRLKAAKSLPDIKTWVQEMLAFEVKLTDTGHDTYGAWREGAHDDLVLAVALACWLGGVVKPQEPDLPNPVYTFADDGEPKGTWDPFLEYEGKRRPPTVRKMKG